MIAICLIIFSIQDVIALNIAPNGTARLCENSGVPQGLFDGIRNVSYDIDMTRCKKLLAISIKLPNPYFIHYVHVFPGPYPTKHRNLDYMLVTLTESKNLFECSAIPETLRMIDTSLGLRVNCVAWGKSFHEVTIRLSDRRNFELAEIEIHTLASGVPGEDVLFHRGCFSRMSKESEIPLTEFASCWSHCLKNKYSLMAIEGNKCSCAKNYEFEDEVILENCDKICITDSETKRCGGDGFYSVYIVIVQLPNFYGCSKGDIQLNDTISNLTIAECLYVCNRYRFAAVKGDTCACTDAALSVESIPGYCDSPCPSNPNEACGGKDSMAVFGTCIKESYYLSCDKLLQCDSKYDKFGECFDGCKSGFDGDYCIERVMDMGITMKNKYIPVILAVSTIFIVRKTLFI